MGVLRRAVRKDCGKVTLKPDLIACLANQYHEYPHWTYQLHYDNLQALVKTDAAPRPLRSYSTVRRYVVAQGLTRKPRPRPKQHPGQLLAAQRRERRRCAVMRPSTSGSLALRLPSRLAAGGHTPWPVAAAAGVALGILSTIARYCPHLQWYLSETTEDLVHGFSQGVQKCGLPRGGMSDNGSAMLAEEFTGRVVTARRRTWTTLPYSAYQNGKQECFWAQLEGRLMEMLGQVRELTLEFLNQATQAWVEIEYNRRVHREIGCAQSEAIHRCAGRAADP